MPYLFIPTMGKNGIIIDVPPGGAVQVGWKAPWLVFLKGPIAATAPRALAAQVAPVAALAVGGWHADPAGRHQQRYFDGAGWTDHVVDAGVQSTDPLGG